LFACRNNQSGKFGVPTTEGKMNFWKILKFLECKIVC
jgi:hypothetical protein